MSDMLSRQEQIEEELRAAKEQLEIILTNIADGIVVQDANGKIIYANHAAALLTGYDSVEAWLAAPPLAYLEKFDIFDEQGNPFPLKNLPGRRAIQGEAEPRETVRYVNKQTGEAAWNILKSTAIFDHEHWREPFQGLVSDYIFPAKSSNVTGEKFGLKVKGGTVLRSVLPFLFTICMDKLRPYISLEA